VRPFGRAFLPGPTDVHPDVLAAMLEPMYFTMGPRLQALVAEAQAPLQELFGTAGTVFLATSAATGLMEAGVRNGVRRRVLVVTGGYFGELFARVAEGVGKEVIRAEVPPGEVMTEARLAALLEEHDPDAVALVHSETSTGVLAPLPRLAAVVRARPDTLLLVDAVTSVGALPIAFDAWGVDYLFAGSQKAMALPPGIALGAASERFLARADTIPDRGWYLSVPNLVRAARRNLAVTTPALPVYHALRRQLERIEAAGGLPPRFQRHAAMAAILHRWVADHPGVRLVAPEGARSPSISVVMLPEGRDAASVVDALEARGWLVAGGLAPLAGRAIRIGHMGDLEPEHLTGLLAELSAVLAE
jgi:aspartate aminotransferase-like enzyme